LEVFCYYESMKQTVYMMLGITGSGKTTFAHELSAELGIEVLSLDQEYSHLGGNLKSHEWNEEAAFKAGEQVKDKLGESIEKGQSVILDFCPWNKEGRNSYRDLVTSLGAACHIYYFDIPKQTLLKRLTGRNASANNEQVVTESMLDNFFERFEPPINEDVELIK